MKYCIGIFGNRFRSIIIKIGRIAYEVVNGYYHCKDYVIFEVDGVYSLTDGVSVSAQGVIGESAVNACGKYSIDNYVSGISASETLPDYIKALYSYAYASKNYIEMTEND